MLNVGGAVAYLYLDKSNFKNGLRSVGDDLKNVVSRTNTAGGRFKNLGSAISKTGGMLKAPSIAAGGFLGHALKTATNFQAQMSKVQAISGASASEMGELTKKAREWGAKTKFSASECGQAFEYMGMAGWKAQEMTDGLPGILNLAAASGEDLGKTSDIVTDALTAFGLKAKDSANFADLLAAASTNSNTNVSMLGESFKYCAPVCGALGISAKDTSFALGLMANAGIKGSSSGTALRTSLVNLSKPTKNMQKAMDKLGISLTDSHGKVKEGKQLFDELRQKFGKLTDAQKAQYAATIFGKESMSGMLAVINASDKDYNKLYGSLNKSNGAAEKMANTMQNNVKGAITNFKSAFEEMEIGLTQALLPTITKIILKINQLMAKFNALPQGTKDKIAKVVVGIMAIAPALMIFGKIVSIVGTVVNAIMGIGKAIKTVTTIFRGVKTAISIFQALPALLSPPVLIIIGIIAAVAFAAYEIVKHWSKIKAFFSKLWNGIKNIFVKFWNWLKGFMSKWGPLLLVVLAPFIGIPLLIKKHWSKIKNFFSKLWNAIKSIFVQFWNWLKGFMSKWGPAILVILAPFIGIPLIIKKHWSKIKGFFTNLWEHLKNVCNKIKETFHNAIEHWKNLWTSFKEFMSNVGHWICDGLLGGLKRGWEKVKGFVGDMADGIKSKFKSILGIHSPSRVFKAYGGFIGEGLIEGLDGMEGSVQEKIGGIGNIITGLAKTKPDFALLRSAFKNMNLDTNLKVGSNLSTGNKQISISLNPEVKVYLNVDKFDSSLGQEKISKNLQTVFKKIIEDTLKEKFINDAFTANGF